MTEAEQIEAELDALARLEAANPAVTFWTDPPGVGCWGMADWQRTLALDPSPRVFLRKGNKVGGSTWLHWTAKAYLDGWHPVWKRPRRPVRIAYIAADLEQSYKRDVSPRLREFFLDHDLSARCHYDGAKGFIVGGGRGLETRRGDLIAFFSGHQGALALAGGSYDVVLVNEPPRQHIWAEALRSAAEHAAPVFVNFTPLPPESLVGGDDLVWLRGEVEDQAKGWSQHVIPLRPDTAPHRTQASIDRQIADMLSWERAQREDAAWEGPAPDRMLEGFSEAVVSDVLGYHGLARILLALDHGERPGNQICLLAYSWVTGGEAFIHIWNEYVSAGRTTEEQDAVFIAGMLDRHDHELLEVDAAVGDVNSAGKSRAGDSVNQALEAAFAQLAGIGRAPFQIVKPRKGRGSVLRNVRLTNSAMLSGRCKIHPRCVQLLRSVKFWRGRDDEHKHAVDALLYLGSEVDPTRGPHGTGRISVT